ncbi:hypothetical protein ABT106_30785, partial [Streptomyces sp. NPDC002044]
DDVARPEAVEGVLGEGEHLDLLRVSPGAVRPGWESSGPRIDAALAGPGPSGPAERDAVRRFLTAAPAAFRPEPGA